MQRLSLKIGSFSIPFWIGYNCYDFIAEDISSFEPDKLFIVSDPNVWNLYSNPFLKFLQNKINVEVLLFSGNENDKSLPTVEKLAEKAINADASRKSIIVAMGGGVVGNVGGMLAGLLFRGIRLIHLPTTLLAMHDSVTSLKQAVNCNGIKNIVGLYHKPSAVYINISFLESLSEKHIWSGIVELVKNALIIGGSYIQELETCINLQIDNLNKRYNQLIWLGIQAKQKFIRDDPYERNKALVFEYGHTLGHAIEISSNGSLTHGESVALGMCCSGWISHYLGYMSDHALLKHNNILNLIKNFEKLRHFIPITKIFNLVFYDNKKGYCDRIPESIDMILLREPGVVVTDTLNGCLLTKVPINSVKTSLEELAEMIG